MNIVVYIDIWQLCANTIKPPSSEKSTLESDLSSSLPMLVTALASSYFDVVKVSPHIYLI